MLYARIRSGMVILFIVLGILLHVQTGFQNAWYLYVAAILLTVSHLLFGTVWLAFRQLGRGKVGEAERLLSNIRRPDLLVKRNRAYYHFTKGMIHLQKKELESGDKHIREALDLGLQRPNDRALANLNLAHIQFVQKSLTEAARFLKIAKSEEPSDLMIKDNIEKLEQALGSRLN